MFLTNSDMVDLVDLRHRLHRRPEISGEERHNPDFDFPDDAIGPGARVFMRALRNLLGEARPRI